MAVTATLSDLYDADRRATDREIEFLADVRIIPHPLKLVRYADGIGECTHAKRHTEIGTCSQSEANPIQPDPSLTDLQRESIKSMKHVLRTLRVPSSRTSLFPTK